MGAYLTQPQTAKASTDEQSETLIVGASSMQGWRNSQEDAHNAILKYDEMSAFFAVYDGHGGAEVAHYCADKLPEYLKNHPTYKNGNPEEALKDAFMDFDKTLLQDGVITNLKILAGTHNIGDENQSTDEENLAELHEESNLPLNEVLEKYKGLPQTHDLSLLQADSAGSGGSLRGRRAAAVAAEAVNKAVMDPTAKPAGSSTSAAAAAALNEIDGPGPSGSRTGKVDPEDESTVSSSSSSASKSTNSWNSSTSSKDEVVTSKDSTNNNNTVAEAAAAPAATPKEQNGNVTSSDAKAVATTANESATTSEDSTVSGSSDVADKKSNGTIVDNEAVVASNPKSADSSSTSKNAKKAVSSKDEDSTDDDDYEHIDAAEAQEMAETSSSSSEDTDNGIDDDDDDDDDENSFNDDNDMEEDDDEEAQMANDQFCANMIEEPGKDSGCTAVVSFLHGRDLYVANAGDSRCVVSRKGQAIEMSLDHKPEDDEESSRIIKAGGRVTLDGRVNGGLNLSRALGDHAYKMNLELPPEKQMISAMPDIRKLIISPDDEFMVLACDGIWNFMSSQEVVDFVRERLRTPNQKLSTICEELFDHCLAPNTLGDGTGCDNMTAVIVKFQDKLQELPATLNPKETIDALLETDAQNQAAHDATAEPSALKRCASPDAGADGADGERAENTSKRVKIADGNSSESADGNAQNSTDANSCAPSQSVEQPIEASVVVSST